MRRSGRRSARPGRNRAGDGRRRRKAVEGRREGKGEGGEAPSSGSPATRRPPRTPPAGEWRRQRTRKRQRPAAGRERRRRHREPLGRRQPRQPGGGRRLVMGAGTLSGRYELGDRLGSGGMSNVYRATDLIL